MSLRAVPRIAQANVAPLPPPSAFASILRRSKLATYDPSIGQVYTTFGGHAHRGDWGVKRPLSYRNRNAAIVISSIDSTHQQTEWYYARAQARWIKTWEEMTGRVTVGEGSNWDQQLRSNSSTWLVDTDYAQEYGKEDPEPLLEYALTDHIPNFAAMEDHQFERYLKRVRKLRPKYKEYLANHPRKSTSADNAHLKFIADHTSQEILYERTSEEAPLPTNSLMHLPHRQAGLSYGYPNKLHGFRFAKPMRGRVFKVEATRSGMLSVGGNVGRLNNHSHSSASDSGPEDNRYRLNYAMLNAAPRVVGPKPQNLRDVNLVAEYLLWKDGDHRKSNTHVPGSRAYVGQDDRTLPTTPSNYFRSRNSRQAAQTPRPVPNRQSNNSFLDMLNVKVNGNRGW